MGRRWLTTSSTLFFTFTVLILCVNVLPCFSPCWQCFAVRSLGWVEMSEEDMAPGKSSIAVNNCIRQLSYHKHNLHDTAGIWGEVRQKAAGFCNSHKPQSVISAMQTQHLCFPPFKYLITTEACGKAWLHIHAVFRLNTNETLCQLFALSICLTTGQRHADGPGERHHELDWPSGPNSAPRSAHWQHPCLGCWQRQRQVSITRPGVQAGM